MNFKNREEAGLFLALRFKKRTDIKNALVIAIPRGGVVVGNILSTKLHRKLSLVIVKKIGAPHNPELAIGALGSNGIVFWDENILEDINISSKEKQRLIEQKEKEVNERELLLGVSLPDVTNKTVILVDDGVATGATVTCAALILKKQGAKRLILATPVIAKDTKKKISSYFDEIVALITPLSFYAVGQFYEEFPQVEDWKVKELLNEKT